MDFRQGLEGGIIEKLDHEDVGNCVFFYAEWIIDDSYTDLEHVVLIFDALLLHKYASHHVCLCGAALSDPGPQGDSKARPYQHGCKISTISQS